MRLFILILLVSSFFQATANSADYQKFSDIVYDLSLLDVKEDYRPTNVIIAINEIEKHDIKIDGVRVISSGSAIGIPVEIKKTMDGKLILYIRSDFVEAPVNVILNELNIKTELTEDEINELRMKQSREDIIAIPLDDNKEKGIGEKITEKLAKLSSYVLSKMQNSNKTKIISSENQIPTRNYYKTFDEVFEKSEYEQKFGSNADATPLYNNKNDEENDKQDTEMSENEKKQKEALVFYNEGYKLAESGDLDVAISKYDKAIEIYPEFSAAYNNRGFTYAEQKEYQKAISDYNKAIELDNKFASAYYNRGTTYSDMGEQQKAIDDYDMVLKIDPSFVNAYYNRASTYKELGKNDLALSDYNQALLLDPNFAIGYYNRGYIYFQMEDLDKAIADFNRAIQIDHNFAGAYLSLGNILSQKGDLYGAISNYDAAINIDPNDPTSFYLRGGVNAHLGNFTEAANDYTKAIELSPEEGVFYHDRAIVYFKLGEYEKSRNDAKKTQDLGEQVEQEFLDALANVQ